MENMSKLKNVRNLKKLSQSELATASGIKLKTLQKYEQGQKNIDGAKIKTLAQLAQALDCKIVDIIEDTETIEILKKIEKTS